MQYKDQLKKKEWQKRRIKILERDNWTCQMPTCKTPDEILNVHHKFYFEDLQAWEYPDDMLVALCETCHKKESEERNNLEKHLSNTLKMKGFFVSDLFAMSCLIETDYTFTNTLLKVLRKFQNG